MFTLRSCRNEKDASPIAYAHDRANRLTDWAGHAQAYDLAGNVTLAFSAAGDKSYTYRYDHLNQLTAVYDSTDTTRKAAFTYDALGRRIEHINDVLGRNRRPILGIPLEYRRVHLPRANRDARCHETPIVHRASFSSRAQHGVYCGIFRSTA
ncbi:MAG: hypothetical protein L6R00_21180 [Phycisphaerae bacterium]|nr:hypothetical protein [Phycisphaerae bacterium]